MFEPQYLQQVKLLLEILPALDRFPGLALHGGTAINLFYRPLPRLSVDIDLTWKNAGQRARDLEAIRDDLRSLQKVLQKSIPQCRLHLNETQPGIYKLYCQKGKAQVKVEVNTVNRGLLEPAQRRVLHPGAQELLERFCEVQLVGYGQLFGGKWVAALDRQHPRDVFDVMGLLNTDGYTRSLHRGILFCLLSSKRPLHELLEPARLDQREVLQRQFAGMTQQAFTYRDFEQQRERLINMIREKLSEEDKDFLTTFTAGEPPWEREDWTEFPAIRWKWQNLLQLKQTNPGKHQVQCEQLYRVLFP